MVKNPIAACQRETKAHFPNSQPLRLLQKVFRLKLYWKQILDWGLEICFVRLRTTTRGIMFIEYFLCFRHWTSNGCYHVINKKPTLKFCGHSGHVTHISSKSHDNLSAGCHYSHFTAQETRLRFKKPILFPAQQSLLEYVVIKSPNLLRLSWLISKWKS